jgi:hypothetical protein
VLAVAAAGLEARGVKRYIYMNHRIREPKPSGPVIAVQTGKRVRSTNRVQLVHQGAVIGEVRFEPNGLRSAPSHHVRAFVEIFGDVRLKYPGK